MPRSIAILGASGAVGSTLAAQILRSELLEPNDRLQLVGHGASASEAKLLGTRIDLLDAFDDERVEIEMVPKIEDVDADIVVVTSGVGPSDKLKDRRDLGAINRAIFEEIAEICAQRVPDALFVVVSNPVELGVKILADRLDRKKVFGMGAQQDSLRFARAVAKTLRMSRKDVRASVLGEHGQAMVPLWSTVELLSERREHHAALDDLKKRASETPLRERVAALHAEVLALLESNDVPEAYEACRRALPDARIFVQPFITYHCMHSTPNATANATLMCLAAIIAADARQMHGQVLLEGEVYGLRGVCGVPITLNSDGWHVLGMNSIDDVEQKMLHQAAESITSFNESVLATPAPGHDVS